VGRASRTVGAVVAAWAALLALNRSLRRVRGESMAPTLRPGDVVLTVPLRRPRRGQVVIVRDPRDPDHEQVKRVLALPGERLQVSRGHLLVDGVGHVEPYAVGRGPDGSLDVPADHVAVLGDARDASTDSRAYGAVPLELVDARVVARVAPRPRLLRGRTTGLAVTGRAEAV
jgi:signal peptidase I